MMSRVHAARMERDGAAGWVTWAWPFRLQGFGPRRPAMYNIHAWLLNRSSVPMTCSIILLMLFRLNSPHHAFVMKAIPSHKSHRQLSSANDVPLLVNPLETFENIAAGKHAESSHRGPPVGPPHLVKFDTVVARCDHDTAISRIGTLSFAFGPYRAWDRAQGTWSAFPAYGSNLLARWPFEDRNPKGVLWLRITKGRNNLPSCARLDERGNLRGNIDRGQRRPRPCVEEVDALVV